MASALPRGYVYEIATVDYWTGWVRLNEYEEQEDYSVRVSTSVSRRALERVRDHAIAQIRERSIWEGDIVQGPFFAGLPPRDGNSDSEQMVAIKQQNNGMTFVWSPYPLPWLQEPKLPSDRARGG
jgi:hypothetical protein